MNFPGSGGLPGGGIPGGGMIPGLSGGGGAGQAGAGGMSAQEQQQIAMMKAAMESCPVKTVMAGVMGFGLGGAFGLFMSSMRYDTPLHMQAAAHANAKDGIVPKAFTDLPVREQLRHGLKDMGRQSWSSAKNFGYLGGMFAGIECCIEGLRGKNDAYNGIAGGFLTGGILARRSGPGSMLFGAVGFAVFSGAIEWYMRKPDGERRFPVE